MTEALPLRVHPSDQDHLLLTLLALLLLPLQSLVYGTPRKDTAEIREDLRKAELFINNRGSCSDPAPSSSSEGSGSVAASSTGSSSSSESNSGVPGAGRFTCFELFR
jgi:hypothetical protein